MDWLIALLRSESKPKI